MWIRYTVHKPPDEEPHGSVWFTLFEAGAGGPVAAKETLPGRAAGERDWIRVGEASGIGSGAGVRLGGLRVVGAHASSRTRSRSSTSRATGCTARRSRRRSSCSPLPGGDFGGRLGVGDRQISLDGWHGMVGHNWGAEHAERWIWLHGADRGRRLARRRDRQGEHRRR